MQYNNKLNELQQEFNDEVWDAFHNAEINDQDDFYDYMHQYLDNAVIYYADCDAILENNNEYHYHEHGMWGKPDNVTQAAYACLYDYLTENDDTVVWSQLEEVLNEAEQ
jgi:hypothetical protein